MRYGAGGAELQAAGSVQTRKGNTPGAQGAFQPSRIAAGGDD
jgi:hypothetical protein